MGEARRVGGVAAVAGAAGDADSDSSVPERFFDLTNKKNCF